MILGLQTHVLELKFILHITGSLASSLSLAVWRKPLDYMAQLLSPLLLIGNFSLDLQLIILFIFHTRADVIGNDLPSSRFNEKIFSPPQGKHKNIKSYLIIYKLRLETYFTFMEVIAHLTSLYYFVCCSVLQFNSRGLFSPLRP